LCDVVPIEASHVLLDRLWQFDRDVHYDGHANIYTFLFKKQRIILMPLSPSEVYNDQLKMRAKKDEEKKVIESKDGKEEQRSKRKKSECQKHRNITLLERKKELKKNLLIRQSLSIDLCRDLYVHLHLEILPSYTLYSLVPWKEENHALHLETLYSSGLNLSFRLPALHFISDLSYLSLFSLSPI